MPPKWLIPWLVPIGLAIAVILVVINVWVGAAFLLVVLCVGLPYLRIQYLKQHPPDPELKKKRFGGFDRPS